MRLKIGHIITFAGLFYGFLSVGSFAANIDDLLVYRAVYELQLESVRDKSNISGLGGRMVYEFSGSRCEGFTTRFRFVTKIDIEDSPSRLSDQQSTSFESADGQMFRFANKSYTDQELTKEVTGSAHIINKKVKVDVTKPEANTYNLPLAEFPTAHTLEVIDNAIAGKHFYRAQLFDGSDDANTISETTVVIGDKYKPKADSETKVMGHYGNDEVWPVTISYFDDKEHKDGLPAYRTSFLLYKNGMTRDLVMDYGDFSLRGKLVRFDVFDQSKVKAGCNK